MIQLKQRKAPLKWGSFKNFILILAIFFNSIASAPANSDSPQIRIALTVDDLPKHGKIADNEDRIQIAKSLLSVFKKHQIPEVVGFVNGKHVDDDTTLIKVLNLWQENGYPLGNHTYSHSDLSLVSTKEFEQEIHNGEKILKKIEPSWNLKYFRYPFLHEGNSVLKREQIRQYLKSNGYIYVPVTLDYKDYLFNAPLARCLKRNDHNKIAELKKLQLETVTRLIDHQIEAGRKILGPSTPHILLIHIGSSQAKWFDEIATLLEKKGTKWISISEALKEPLYKFDPAVETNNGGLFTTQMSKLKKIDFTPYPDEAKLEATLKTYCR